MNANPYLKPDLLDLNVRRKIMNRLKPPQEDYWAPAKSGFRTFFDNYIKTNIMLVVIIVIIILFLIYRYRITKKDREIKAIENFYSKQLNDNKQPNSKNSNDPTNNCAELLLQLYEQQKDKMRDDTIAKKAKNESKMAYPIYPYSSEGELSSPSSSKKYK